MVDEITQHTADRSPPLEDSEDQADCTLHSLIWIQCDLARRLQHVATRKAQKEFATTSLGTSAFVHTGLEDVKLRLAHRSLEPKKKAIIVSAGIINTIGIAYERVEQSAHFEQLRRQPSPQARSARPYCKRVDSLFSTTCRGVD